MGQKIEKLKFNLTIEILYGKILMVEIDNKRLVKASTHMLVNYNKLWKLLIDRKLLKKDLRKMAGVSTNAMAKMGRGEDVSTQVLRKICGVLDCKIEDIIEIAPEDKP